MNLTSKSELKKNPPVITVRVRNMYTFCSVFSLVFLFRAFFLTTYLPKLPISTLLMLTKIRNFGTTYPPLIANVVCTRRLMKKPFNIHAISIYSRVWNKRTPLNKHSPLEKLAKRIIVAPFLPYTMKSGIRQ